MIAECVLQVQPYVGALLFPGLVVRITWHSNWDKSKAPGERVGHPIQEVLVIRVHRSDDAESLWHCNVPSRLVEEWKRNLRVLLVQRGKQLAKRGIHVGAI